MVLNGVASILCQGLLTYPKAEGTGMAVSDRIWKVDIEIDFFRSLCSMTVWHVHVILIAYMSVMYQLLALLTDPGDFHNLGPLEEVHDEPAMRGLAGSHPVDSSEVPNHIVLLFHGATEIASQPLILKKEHHVVSDAAPQVVIGASLLPVGIPSLFSDVQHVSKVHENFPVDVPAIVGLCEGFQDFIPLLLRVVEGTRYDSFRGS